MNADEIRALLAGRELDVLVAEKVMGYHGEEEETFSPSTAWVWRDRQGFKIHGGFKPSTDIAAAWQVAEKLRMCVSCPGASQACGEYSAGAEYEAETREGVSPPGYAFSTGPTAPLAICRCALLTVG